MDRFDGITLKLLRGDIDAALQTVAAKHGITLKMGNATYARDGSYFLGKVEGGVVRNGQAMTKEASAFEQYAEMYGLKDVKLGDTFKAGGISYKITGLKTTRTGKPVMAQKVGTDSHYVFTIDAVKRAFGISLLAAFSDH